MSQFVFLDALVVKVRQVRQDGQVVNKASH
jgi:transposase-like protein